MQVRAGFNGWDCDDPADCEMTRTPGTNIFSLAASVTGFPNTESEFKYYMELDSSSIEVLNATYGVIYDGIGWEDSPQFGGGNRIFVLGADDGTGLLELDLAGYYDLPAGGVIPAGQTVAVTFTVDMTDAEDLGFNAAEDSVYLSIKDRWLKYLQGLGDDYKVIASANGDGTSTLDLSLSKVTTGSFFLITAPGLIKISIISTFSKSPISGTVIFVAIIDVLFIPQFNPFSAM